MQNALLSSFSVSGFEQYRDRSSKSARDGGANLE